MKKQIFKFLPIGIIATSFMFSSCNSDDNSGNVDEPIVNEDRWLTIAGAMMGTQAGDGNGGTAIFAISTKDAKDPNKTISLFESNNGFLVRSQRTARLQASEDGNTMFNITYGGAGAGGIYTRFKVNGGGNFEQFGNEVDISGPATSSPRWVKLFDGDKTGVAVNVSEVANVGTPYEYTVGKSVILSLDLQNPKINNVQEHRIRLNDPAAEKLGHYIFRLDAPLLNKSGNKLVIGTWMGKRTPGTTAAEDNFERLGSKSVVVDYPSLANPKVITSTVGFGDTSGYRSFNSFLGDDGNIYQATQRDTKGAHILRINQDNEYDNSYVFNLDTALGVKGSSVQNWRYAGKGIAYVMYTYTAATKGISTRGQSFLARVDLNSKTATQVNLPYDTDMEFFQYQGFVVNGNEVYIAVAPVGKEGNIYVLNSQTGTVTKGAKLVNRPGNHFIGVF